MTARRGTKRLGFRRRRGSDGPTGKLMLASLVAVGAAGFGHDPIASAQELDFHSHRAVGSGAVRVLDGGPLESASDNTRLGGDPNNLAYDPLITFNRTDATQTGPLGAFATVFGESRVTDLPGGFRIDVTARTGYTPSAMPGGDDPGAMAVVGLSSIVELVVTPQTPITWTYFLDVDDALGFDNATEVARVTVRNITAQRTLLDLRGPSETVEAVLDAAPGDFIRISTLMNTTGYVEPGDGGRSYESHMQMAFVNPEPSTLAMLAAGLWAVGRRRRPRPDQANVGTSAPV